MALLSWKNSYNTGIDEVDTQHKQLLDYLNQLDQARKLKNKTTKLDGKSSKKVFG